MILYLARHGETVDNKRRVLQSHLPGKLNETGEKQAKELAKKIAHIKFDVIFSSDLHRAVATTEAIVKYRDCPVYFTESIRERHFGEFMGRPKDDFFKWRDKYQDNENVKVPGGGESLRDVEKRYLKFIDTIYPKYKDKKVLLSIHGGLIQTILLHHLGKPLMEIRDFPVPDNASIQEIQFLGDGKYKITIQ